jgi:adenine-specific DNA-methyltransferase
MERLAEHRPPSPADDRLERLRELIPEAFPEGPLDWERLREILGADADDGAERFGLGWAGRREALRALREAARGTLEPDREESVGWEATRNLFVEGDNLEVLKLIHRPYFGRVNVIYIDPPYNTGKDFVYRDDFRAPIAHYLRASGQVDVEGSPLTANPETAGRYHSAWLTMIYPRLFLARQLLAETGVIFVSIDDTELANLRLVMNELFGEENFLGTVVWRTATDNNPSQVAMEHEYVLCYARDASRQERWLRPSAKVAAIQERYEALREKHGDDLDAIRTGLGRWIREAERRGEPDLSGVAHYRYVDERGVYYPGNSANTRPGGYDFDIRHPETGDVCAKPANGYRWPETTFRAAAARGDVAWGADHTRVPKIKKRLETATEPLRSVYYEDNRRATKELADLMGTRVFDNPKSPRLLSRLIGFAAGPDALVMDFFAGSGSTAEAVFALNREDGGSRRFILVQLPEWLPKPVEIGGRTLATIPEVARERIRRVIARDGGDAGFRALRLAPSNVRSWGELDPPGDAEAYADQLDLMVDPLVEGWTAEGVVMEIALREGLPPDGAVAVERAGRLTLHRVTDALTGHRITLCLDDQVRMRDIEGLPVGKDDVLVCRDAALDDETAANLSLRCRLKLL